MRDSPKGRPGGDAQPASSRLGVDNDTRQDAASTPPPPSTDVCELARKAPATACPVHRCLGGDGAPALQGRLRRRGGDGARSLEHLPAAT